MVMPAVKHDNIKYMIKKYDAGELDAISAHAISSGDRSGSFRLIILRRQKRERVVPVRDDRSPCTPVKTV